MEIGETIVNVGDSPILGPPRITLHQPQPLKPPSASLADIHTVLRELVTIRNLLSLIEQNTRPKPGLWERIKSWLGTLVHRAT